MTDKMREDAIREAARNHAGDEYFNADRAYLLVSPYSGRIFDAGFDRGWQASQSAAVPVVGDVEALICDDCGAETNDPWHSSKGTNRHYHRCDPCNSISTTELDALRKDAERLQKDAERMQKALLDIAEWTDRYTKPGHPISNVARAAIAGEKK